MKKTVRVGTIKTRGGRRASVYCRVEYEEGRLSISGVVGPLPSGNCLGGCRQIDMDFDHARPEDNDPRTTNPIKTSQINFAPGWSPSKWLDFLEIWKRWHLNDMNPGCEHQRAEGWGKKKIILIKPRLNEWKVRGGVRPGDFPYRLYEKVKIAAAKGEIYTPKSEAERSWLDGKIIEIQTEEKTSGWVYPREHPDGVLTKPCPVCGYKYGTEWKRVEVPKEVIDFLSSLPSTDKVPAWV